MPQKTFFNLPEERQKEIANICFEEFALNDFESASLSNIIKKAGVAKGSFYRYFESKEDLFRYLFDLSRNLMETEYKKKMAQSDEAFINNWKGYLKSLSEIEKEYPMLIRFQFKVALDISAEDGRNDTGQRLGYKIEYFKDIIDRYVMKSEIRDDIPADIISTVIIYVQLGILGYLQLISSRHDDGTAKGIFNLPENQIDDFLDSFMNIVFSGIRSQ